MQRRIIVFLSILLTGILAAQGIDGIPEGEMNLGQKVGLEITVNDRTFSTINTRNTTAKLCFEYPLVSGADLLMSVGINKHLIPAPSSSISDMKSKMGLYGICELYYQFGFLYGHGGVVYYKAKGIVTETINEKSYYQYDNNYSFLEYPVGVGLILEVNTFRISVGAQKTYLAGKNIKAVTLTHFANTSDLSNREFSFTDQLPLAIRTAVRFRATSKYSLQINYDLYPDGKYQAGLTLWSAVTQTVSL